MGTGGRIIFIGSNLGEQVPFPGLSIYSTSKFALVGLTKALARDLGPREITVNIVQPGSTDTDMNPANGDHAEAQLALMAIPRFGKAQDIAGLVTFLAGEESRFITGSSITIDGGANICSVRSRNAGPARRVGLAGVTPARPVSHPSKDGSTPMA